MIRNAKAIVRRAWLESTELEQTLAPLKAADPRRLARLVRRLVKEAGPQRTPPLTKAECIRLWRTYLSSRLGSYDAERCRRCAGEIVRLTGAPPASQWHIERALKHEIVGTRSRKLHEWLVTNWRFLIEHHSDGKH